MSLGESVSAAVWCCLLMSPRHIPSSGCRHPTPRCPLGWRRPQSASQTAALQAASAQHCAQSEAAPLCCASLQGEHTSHQMCAELPCHNVQSSRYLARAVGLGSLVVPAQCDSNQLQVVATVGLCQHNHFSIALRPCAFVATSRDTTAKPYTIRLKAADLAIPQTRAPLTTRAALHAGTAHTNTDLQGVCLACPASAELW